MRRGGCALVASVVFVLHVATPGIAGSDPYTGPDVLVVVLDGLRPDYVTHDRMPVLSALSEQGVFCENHHAVFPTVTRVNSAAIATGAYPATNGLMGNSVYFPEVDAERGLTTSDVKNLEAIEAATNGRLLTVPSLGEVLARSGKRLLVLSSGSSGSASLQNHKFTGGGVINVNIVRPESLQERVDAVLGPVPEDAAPNTARNRWAVDGYLKLGLDTIRPDVAVIWLSDPDHTAHGDGVGTPVTCESLRQVDQELARILAAHQARGIRPNVIVMSDHGFMTRGGGAESAVKTIADEGYKDLVASKAVIKVDAGLYLNDAAKPHLPDFVRLLQAKPWTGAVFTKAATPGSPLGEVPGTLSYDLAHLNHPRVADVVVDVAWTDEPNEAGFPGTTASPGTAGHGTSGVWDIHNTLIVAGPAFKRALRSAVPTGNVDIAPTVCSLLGVSGGEEMEGRVLSELLADGPAPAVVAVEHHEYTATADLDTSQYAVTAYTSTVDDHRYLDCTRVVRTPK